VHQSRNMRLKSQKAPLVDQSGAVSIRHNDTSNSTLYSLNLRASVDNSDSLKQRRRTLVRKLAKTALALMLVTPLLPAITVTPVSAAPTIELKSEEIITEGAMLKSYVWKTERSGKQASVNAKVIQIDLQNPYVKVDVMTGTGGQFTKKNTVMGMATDTKAVGGINGDFYNVQYEGVPVGPQISNGQLMATPPYLPGFYTFGITKDRKPVVELFTLDTESKITAKDGASYTLGGINKTAYWYEPSKEHSMIDGLYMYTSAWAQISRANDGVTAPKEVLVVNNVVKEIATSATYGVLQMIAPENGYILRASGKAADFVTEHIKVGDPIKADYNIFAVDRTLNYDYKNFQMMIGGHTILVDGGQPSSYSRSINDISGYSARSRTAVGYSQDERYVYLITADLSGESKGVTIPELQDLMIRVGVWKGINLDGGGSTQMVARPFGESDLKLVSALETGSERKVVNGLGVFSLAPKGQVKGLKIDGPSMLFAGEKIAYALKGYDEYYNPVAAADIQAGWTSTSGVAYAGENTFTAVQKGQATITAQAGLAKETKTIQVVGSEELAELKIEAYPPVLRAGESVSLKVLATSKSGEKRYLPSDLLTWEVRGVKGAVADGNLKVDDLQGAQQGLVIARYDGYSTMTALTVGETKTFADFDRQTYKLSFEATEEVTGSVKLASQQSYLGHMYGRLVYDFSKGTGTKAAYAAIEDKNVTVPGEPQSIQIDVNGDNSLNWLRMEFIDGEGHTNRVDLAKNVNWKGWKTITADLTAHKMVYPIKITRLYVASVEQGQDERELTGAIEFDNIKFQYKGAVPALPRNQVALTIDKKAVQVNGASQTVDQAPLIVAGNTLVPIRFVTEALGGTVDWNNDERKVTIVRGQQMMEFRLGQKDYLADGVRKTAEVSPEIRGESTMVPLRVLTEYLGWKVNWDQNTRTVTLE
jgi:trimeric autotransporter adhesin